MSTPDKVTLLEAATGLIEACQDAGHETGWCDADDRSFIVFFTVNPEHAKQVRDVLGAAGLLCGGDLGRVEVK